MRPCVQRWRPRWGTRSGEQTWRRRPSGSGSWPSPCARSWPPRGPRWLHDGVRPSASPPPPTLADLAPRMPPPARAACARPRWRRRGSWRKSFAAKPSNEARCRSASAASPRSSSARPPAAGSSSSSWNRGGKTRRPSSAAWRPSAPSAPTAPRPPPAPPPRPRGPSCQEFLIIGHHRPCRHRTRATTWMTVFQRPPPVTSSLLTTGAWTSPAACRWPGRWSSPGGPRGPPAPAPPWRARLVAPRRPPLHRTPPTRKTCPSRARWRSCGGRCWSCPALLGTAFLERRQRRRKPM
mmetsp:Transcript_113825/g.332549  ORF Transcript_113825/g.332549 Transcript_113825/m.332549 type:complete len:294 (+) Transcript_113825:489-1370(+)